MHGQSHPDPETLDRLRAGLLDEQPAEKAALESHLGACESCRAQLSAWTRIAAAAMQDQPDPGRLQRDLQHARSRALAAGRSQAAGRHRFGFVPYATAALLLIAVSFGVWNYQHDSAGGLQETPAVAQSVPDIYEDLDFYLWLANQDEVGAEDSNGNPNST